MVYVFQAGMFAIRARRKVATERDFLDAVEKVVRQGTKFSSTYVSTPFLRFHSDLWILGLYIKFITRAYVISCNDFILFVSASLSILSLL